MAHPLTIPTIGVLALVGSGLGLYLGNAAISEINPLYFTDPPARFHADLAPNRGGHPGSLAPRMTGADYQGLGESCIGCRDYPEEYFPVHEASVDGYDRGLARSAEPAVQLAAYEPEPAEQVMRRRADIERVERYARGPVVEEAVEAPAIEAPVPAPEPAVEVPVVN
jgi:hypothetical protein